jgi:hypothetical protein
LESLVFNASYHVAEELRSRKPYRYFDSALTYNLYPTGYAGVTLSYTKGQAELNGDKKTSSRQLLASKLSYCPSFGCCAIILLSAGEKDSELYISAR